MTNPFEDPESSFGDNDNPFYTSNEDPFAVHIFPQLTYRTLMLDLPQNQVELKTIIHSIQTISIPQMQAYAFSTFML